MRRVSLRELHEQTGHLVREAAAGYTVVVTDRGRPIATIVPYDSVHPRATFATRELLPEFAELDQHHFASDATADVSADRDGR
jgi:prevent-host-death family protein